MVTEQSTTKDKISKGRPITDNKATLLFKDLLRPILSFIASFRIPYKVVIEQACCPMSGKPVIYAVNHFCFADTPIMGRITPKRSYILLGKQRLGFSDWLYFVLNGVIFVDRKDKEDMSASKQAMAAYLNKGRSIVMFPEGTWNLTENQLMLPMKWGIIDIAKETGAQIIPTLLEYDREEKKCFVWFGAPLVVSPEENKADAIAALRDTLATMRWEFWELKGIFSRGGQGAVAVGDESHPVVVFLQDRRREAAQGVSAPIVAADVHNAIGGLVLHQPVALRRQRRQVHVGVGVLGADQIDAGLCQHLLAVRRAEVGVDDVQVGNADRLALSRQIQGVVYGDIGLAAAIMPGK